MSMAKIETRASRARRAGQLIAVLIGALFLVGIAGCGQSNNSGTGGNQNSPVANQTDRDAELVKYAQCMREHGVPSFPDPVEGRLQLRVRPGSDMDPESPTYQAAVKACKTLEPPGLAEAGQSGDQQEQMLKFVKCMRENGVPNFPDPQPDGRILMQRGPGLDPDSPEFKATEDKCRKELGGFGPRPGP